MMEKILEYLKNNEFKINKDCIIADLDDKEITHIYTEKDNICYCIIAPHDGNNNKFLLRINPKKTLDRWGVCDIQIPFNTYGKLIQYLEFHEIQTYKKLLYIYIERYLESCDINE